ncbi:MAG: RHS repeat-associated core domain-containing protein [Verrucomicrobia bacterium]|nr:RHS repeat-associated core domain-containing protein [Verrucomicrobiota bacterium]
MTNWTGSSLKNTAYYSWTQNGTNCTAWASSTSGSGGSTASVTLTGLNPSATYHYWVQSVAYSNGRYIASRNDAGGNGHTFGTPTWVAVSDLCYSNLSTESVDIHWNVQNDSSLTATHTILFEDGLGTFTNVFTDAGPGSTNVILSVSNLMAGGEYSYQVISYVNDANGYGSTGVAGYYAYTNGTFSVPAVPLIQITCLQATNVQADSMLISFKSVCNSPSVATYIMTIVDTNNVPVAEPYYWWSSGAGEFTVGPQSVTGLLPTNTYYCIVDSTLVGADAYYSSAITNAHSVLEVTTPNWLDIPLSPTVTFDENGLSAISWNVVDYFTGASAWMTNWFYISAQSFNWTGLTGAVYYPEVTLSGLQPGTVYNYWVREDGSDGVNFYSVTNNANGTNYSLPTLPTPLQTANTAATTERFIRNSCWWGDPTYMSFVIPLSQQKGVGLDPMTNDVINGATPWLANIPKDTNWHYQMVTATSAVYGIEFQYPIAAFGSSVGGTPLHVGQSYSFGAYSGYPPVAYASNTVADFRIKVFDRSSSSVVGSIPIYAPRKPTGTTIWCDDEWPSGAAVVRTGNETWAWTNSPTPISGYWAHKSEMASALHYHGFTNATQVITPGNGDSLFAYVYLDPANPPQQIELVWTVGGYCCSAYWGASGANSLFGLGSDSHRIGSLPSTGQWVRLEVPVSTLGLEGVRLDGILYALDSGAATWDAAGIVSTTEEVIWWGDGWCPVNAGLIGNAVTAEWVNSDPTPISGSYALQVTATQDPADHYFGVQNATQVITPGHGDSLFAYVYLDPGDTPQEIELLWQCSQGWVSAYWGTDSELLPYVSISSHYMGPLPSTGQWVRLEVPASTLELEGVPLSGLCYAVDSGKATWNATGIKKNYSETWASYATNGYRQVVSSQYGLTTTIQLAEGANAYNQWGVNNAGPCSPFILTHTASETAKNYYFIVEARGEIPAFWDGPSVAIANNDNAPAWNSMYSLEFEDLPAWRSIYVAQPQFQGEPLPQEYANKSLDELMSGLTTTNVALSTSGLAGTNSYMTLNASPELRQHPLLDKLVSDLKADPLALAAYVQNEIELTDAIGYNIDGSVTEESINPCGVNRGALGVLLEKQGSPIEQCALLVYLLRKAGCPASYVFPQTNTLKMLDVQMSRMLRMQIKGAVDPYGNLYTTNTLLAVNYPWVTAYVNGGWTNLFPWIKDTEVAEGLDLSSLIPSASGSGRGWIRSYLTNTNLAADGLEYDTPVQLLVGSITNFLSANDSTHSIADIGVRAVNRRKNYTCWGDFPHPLALSTNNARVLESLSQTNLIFDTVSVKIFSQEHPEVFVQTTPMYMAEVHNRKLLAWHTKTNTSDHCLALYLAPFHPTNTSINAFGTNWWNAQATNVTLTPAHTNLLVRIEYKRQRNLDNRNPGAGFLNFAERLEASQDRPFSKGDMAAICFNVGRVTPEMTRVHASEYWAYQAQAGTTTTNVQVYPGSLLYLMGMEYYRNCSESRAVLQSLYKTTTLSSYAHGLAKLAANKPNGKLPTDGTINLVAANVDMMNYEVAVAGYGTLHADIPANLRLAQQDFQEMLMTDGSAQEHRIINQFWNYTNSMAAISTVKLLQLAEARKASLGGTGMIEVTSANLNTVGGYIFDGKPLAEHAPSIWSEISNSVAATAANYPDSYYNVAFVTPGPVTNKNYKGLGALIFNANSWWALITENQNTLDGGYAGTYLPTDSFTSINTWQVISSASSSYSAWYLPSSTVTQPSILVPAVITDTYATALATSVKNGASVLDPSSSASLFQSYSTWSAGASIDWSNKNTQQAAILQTKSSGDLDGGITRWWGDLTRVVADPVNPVTGEFYIDATDLHLNGPMPIQVRRNYSSQNLAENEFGYGWKLNYEPYLYVNGSNSVIYAAEMDGSVIAYGRQGTNSVWLPTTDLNPMLNNVSHGQTSGLANMFNATLILTNGIYYLTGPDHSQRTYVSMSFTNSSLIVSRPYLTEWKDNRGNKYTFSYGTTQGTPEYGNLTRVDSSNGNFVGFEYDFSGHITGAFTRDGRRLQYDYDQYGDLVKVTLPTGHAFQYEYKHEQTTVNGQAQWYSTHLIVRETKPEGRLLENDYDSLRRVTRQRSTTGTSMLPVPTASFGYSESCTTGAITGYTTITNCFNKVTRYDYTNSLITQITDPLGHTMTQEWFYTNAPSVGGYQRSLKSRTDKRGLRTDYVYDTAGNILSSTQFGNLTGDGYGSNTTSYTYASSNRLETVSVSVGGVTHQTFNTYTGSPYYFLPIQVEKKVGGTSVSTTTLVYESVTAGTLASHGLLKSETRTGLGCNVSSVSEWENSVSGFPTSLKRRSGTGGAILLEQSMRYDLRGNLVELTDSTHGRKLTYDYDAAGNRTAQEVWDTSLGLVSWQYDYYNGNGEVEWSEGPRSSPSDFVWREYDGAGHVKEQIRWRSQAKSDGSGVEAGSGDNLYAITKYEHDDFGNQTKATDARGNGVTMYYDDVGQMTSRTFSAGGTEHFYYEPGGLVTNQINAIGAQTLKQYTSRGQIMWQRNPDGTEQSWRYDMLGRVVSETLPNGKAWGTVYSNNDRTVTRTFSGSNLSAIETKVFDGRGNLIQWTDVVGAVFNRTYDGLDRVTNETGPEQSNQQTAVYTYNYNNDGRKTSVLKGGLTTITTVDALDRPVSVVTSGAQNGTSSTTYSYSADHHSVTAAVGTGGSGISTTTWTDTLGKTVLVKAAGNYSLNVYDQVGNLTATQDEAGKRTRFTYDGLNRVSGKILPDGKLVAFTYDLAGNMLSRQMPGLTWQATYDYGHGGRITHEAVNGSQRSFSYLYDDVGRISSVTEGGITHLYGYDDLSRVSSINSGGLARGFTYDARGLLTSVTGSGTTVSRTYDGYGQLVTESVSTNNNVSLFYTLSQTWDSGGRRTRVQDSASGLDCLFDYDGAGRLKSVAQAEITSAYTYDDANNGLLNHRQLSNASQNRSVTISRDSLGRETGRTTTVGETTPLNETLGWRADSRMLSYANSSGGGEGRAFTYNTRNQLTEEKYGPASPSSRTNLTYAFDLSGMGVRWYMQTNSALYWMQTDANTAWPAKQELSMSSTLFNYPAMGTAPGADSLSVKLDGNTVRDLYYDPTDTAGHWLAFLTLSPGSHTLSVDAYTNSMLAGGATNTFSSLGTNQTAQTTYDGRGYAVKRVFLSNGSQLTQTLTWDGAGRLTAVSQRDQTSNNGYDWTALYDGLGRRLRTVYTPVDGGVACTKLAVTQESWYDPEVEFLELGVSVNGQKHWKMYGPDLNGAYGGLQGIGGLEAVINQSDGVVTPVVNDAFGNAVASVTNSTVVVWNPTRVGGYGPLPGSSAQWLSTNTTLAAATVWRGKRMDPTGYYWMGARYYDPVGGRFLSPDPLGHEASMDLYSYANGDPINGCDPDGRFGKGVAAGWNNERVGWDGSQSSAFSFGYNWVGGPAREGLASPANWQMSDDAYLGPLRMPSGRSPYLFSNNLLANTAGQFWNVGAALYNSVGQSLFKPIAYAESAIDTQFGRGTVDAANAYLMTVPFVGAEVKLVDSLVNYELKVLRSEARLLAKATPASANLIGLGDSLANAAQWIKPQQGVFDVVVHGSENAFHVLHNGKWVQINHRSLATFIGKKGWNGEPIRLISCSSGANPAGIAQNLANKLGVNVTAPNNTVWIHRPNGTLTIGPSADVNNGSWIPFTPGGGY